MSAEPWGLLTDEQRSIVRGIAQLGAEARIDWTPDLWTSIKPNSAVCIHVYRPSDMINEIFGALDQMDIYYDPKNIALNRAYYGEEYNPIKDMIDRRLALEKQESAK